MAPLIRDITSSVCGSGARRRPLPELVEGTLHAEAGFLHAVKINLRGFHAVMPHPRTAPRGQAEPDARCTRSSASTTVNLAA